MSREKIDPPTDEQRAREEAARARDEITRDEAKAAIDKRIAEQQQQKK